MNLVAHQFLSFNNSSLQLGNLLGEVIKGNKFLMYPEDIAKGIILHRAIDTYTDENILVKKCSSYFHSTQGKYAPIITDIVFDYFLIKNWSKYYTLDFNTFKESCYQLFSVNFDNFPENLQIIVESLLKYDWFENYSTFDGIEKTLRGIGQRTKYSNNLDKGLEDIIKYEEELEQNFLKFFPNLIDYSEKYIQSF